MKTITRKEALSKNLSYYFTGKPCRNGHICLRQTRSGNCYICAQKARNVRKCAIRSEVLKLLGNRCVRCSFSDERALQIDHINGGGLREYRENGSWGVYKSVLNHKNQYQLLCANCNWIKRSEENENCQSTHNKTKMKNVLDLLKNNASN
jgi:hypothetical protein